MFEETVKTANGNVKRVMAATREELAEGVAAAKAEPKTVAPDIDSPDHGNVVVSEFIADPKTALENRPPEHFPTSEASKELSRELAGKSKEERREVLNEAVENSSTEEGLAQNVEDAVKGKDGNDAGKADSAKADKQNDNRGRKEEVDTSDDKKVVDSKAGKK